MEALRMHKVIETDGEIRLTGLPYKKGEYVEMIILNRPAAETGSGRLAAQQRLRSGLIGLWKDRDDIQDSAEYARELREKAQNRRG